MGGDLSFFFPPPAEAGSSQGGSRGQLLSPISARTLENQKTSWKAAAGSKRRVSEASWRAREHWEGVRGTSMALLTQGCLTSLITQNVVRMRVHIHVCTD